jgi:hypothetical protein
MCSYWKVECRGGLGFCRAADDLFLNGVAQIEFFGIIAAGIVDLEIVPHSFE